MLSAVVEIDWGLLAMHTLQIIAAFVLAFPVGFNRERARQLGLRTIPLVAVAACGFILIARERFPHDANAQARIIQGVITGVGFLGGGAIVKNEDQVQGTSTAATIWCTAAIGASVAAHLWSVALLLALFNFAILVALRPVEKALDAKNGPRDPPESF